MSTRRQFRDRWFPQSVAVARPLLRELKELLNHAYLAATNQDRCGAFEKAYMVVRTALGLRDQSDANPIPERNGRKDAGY